MRYSQGTATDGFSVTGMAYSNKWNSTDQVPQRAIARGEIDRFGAEDPSDGGNTNRFSLSARMAGTDDARLVEGQRLRRSRATLDLYNNFTYFLSNPVHGDQFHQHDDRAGDRRQCVAHVQRLVRAACRSRRRSACRPATTTSSSA